jgi:hypothetical protein
LRQVQGTHEVFAQRPPHNVFCWQLISLASQTNQPGAALCGNLKSLDLDTGFAKGTPGALKVALLDLHGNIAATDLDRWIIWVQVRRGIKKADRQHSQDQQVLPEGELIEHDAARYEAGRIKRPVEW